MKKLKKWLRKKIKQMKCDHKKLVTDWKYRDKDTVYLDGELELWYTAEKCKKCGKIINVIEHEKY